MNNHDGIPVTLEVGALHGYPRHVVEGLLRAARVRAAARAHGAVLDVRAVGIVRSAVGDGFMLPITAECILRMVRARLHVLAAAARATVPQ